jgi:regulator of sigma E protease
MTAIFDTLVTIVLFILVLGGLVLFHELGHFITARLARVRVLEFGIGFPPRAKGLGRGGVSTTDAEAYRRAREDALVATRSDEAAYEAVLETPEVPQGTEYTLNWLPIGGFVKLEDENGGAGFDPRSFGRARLPIKLGILVAGVLMNLLLAFAIFTGVALWGEPALGVKIGEVAPGSPAASAGLVAGDTLVAVNGQQFSVFDQVLNLPGATTTLRALAGQPVTIGILHSDGTTQDYSLTLRVPSSDKEGALGIGKLEGTEVGTVEYSFGEAVQVGVEKTVAAFGLILAGLGDIGRSILTNPTAPPPAAGPVGIAAQIGDIAFNLGPLYLVFMIGLLSANLALVNILPFPPLDGGRMLVLLLKAIPRYGKRISLRAEQLTYAIGFVALFTFLIWITVFDVARQFGGGTP